MKAAQPAARWLPDFLLLSLLWGSSFLFLQKVSYAMGALPTSWMRVSIAALCLLPLVLLKQQGDILWRHRRELLLVGVFNSGLPFSLYAYALLSITTGLSSILNTMAPLFGALIAWLVFKEQLTRWRTLGMVLGFFGAALLALEAPGGVSFKPGGSGLAIACCLLGGLSYGISGNYTQRYLQHIPPMVLATGSQMGASIALLLPAIWLWPGHAPDLPTWGALFVSAALCTGLAYVLFFRLIAQLGSSGAMTVTYVAPVFASVIGVVVLDEKITGWMLGCAAIVLVGTALATGLLPLKKASVSAR